MTNQLILEVRDAPICQTQQAIEQIVPVDKIDDILHPVWQAVYDEVDLYRRLLWPLISSMESHVR